MKNFFKWLLAIPLFIVVPVTWLGGIAIYFWTIIIAYNMHGFLGAIISFFTPVLSTIYFCIKAWQYFRFDSSFLQWVIIFVVFAIVGQILAVITRVLEE